MRQKFWYLVLACCAMLSQQTKRICLPSRAGCRKCIRRKAYSSIFIFFNWRREEKEGKCQGFKEAMHDHILLLRLRVFFFLLLYSCHLCIWISITSGMIGPPTQDWTWSHIRELDKRLVSDWPRKERWRKSLPKPTENISIWMCPSFYFDPVSFTLPFNQSIISQSTGSRL